MNLVIFIYFEVRDQEIDTEKSSILAIARNPNLSPCLPKYQALDHFSYYLLPSRVAGGRKPDVRWNGD